MATKKKKSAAKKKHPAASKKNKKTAPQSRSVKTAQRGKAAAPAQRAGKQTSAKKSKKSNPAAARRRKRLIDLLMYVFVLIAVASLMIVMALTVFFEIESIVIDVQEEVPYTNEEIISVSGITVGENLLMAQTGKAESEICERLPYIENCTVRRVLPSTMVVEVDRAEIAGLVSTADGYQIIVSTAGKALAPAGDPLAGENVTVISGITVGFSGFGTDVEIEDADVLKTAGEIRSTLAASSLAVESITFDDNGTVSFMYDGRIDCKLGLPTDLDTKLLLIVNMLTDGSIFDYEEGVIDASIDRTAYFTPKSILEQYSRE